MYQDLLVEYIMQYYCRQYDIYIYIYIYIERERERERISVYVCVCVANKSNVFTH